MGVVFGLSTICIIMPFLRRATGQKIRYSGVDCALGPSKSIRYSGDFVIEGFVIAGFFHIFYCNSAGLSYVVCHIGVFVKPRPNDRTMPTQHVATLLGATCCVRLATVLLHVGCCWLKFENGQI